MRLPVALRAKRLLTLSGLHKADKSVRRYATLIERTLATWETSPEEWADYIAFLGRLLKVRLGHATLSLLFALTFARPFKVIRKMRHCCRTLRQSHQSWRNASIPRCPRESTKKLWRFMPTSLPLSVYVSLSQNANQKYSLCHQHEYLTSHLHQYLPGLSSVLSFASLSVRPGLYPLFENHILALPTTALRPALKSLLLALLPAIEEETSEDFDRAYANVETLEHKFTHYGSDGYFWQCLFLGVITSPSRRQGALNYMVRKLPRLTNKAHIDAKDDLGELSAEAEAATSPEPGLLIRCFAAGLSDPQMLIQRSFLDLLVTHVPMHSPALQNKAERSDIDRLMTAALTILLRRDMSLNKRLWAWFLGPEPKGENSSTPQSAASETGSPQLHYFETFARYPLERCMSSMFHADIKAPSQLVHPFRISLSLMDRWEIGGSSVPQIFLPSLKSLHAYSSRAPHADFSEVLRSASLFFDGVEAQLMWAELIDLLQTGNRSDNLPDSLRLLEWVIEHFNIRDEEMTTVHIPLMVIYLLELALSRAENLRAWDAQLCVLRSTSMLVHLIPSRVFCESQASFNADVAPEIEPSLSLVEQYYESLRPANRKPRLPFSGVAFGQATLTRIAWLAESSLQNQDAVALNALISLLASVYSKTTVKLTPSVDRLYTSVGTVLDSANASSMTMPFSILSAMISLSTCLRSKGLVTRQRFLELEPLLTYQIWHHLSPSKAKHHIEAVKAIWQVDELASPSDTLRVSLMNFMRTPSRPHGVGTASEALADTVRSFAVLWLHSIPSQQNTAMPVMRGSSRRVSATATTSDTGRITHRLESLGEPLMLTLDRLSEKSSSAAEAVKYWLRALPSLDRVLWLLLQRISKIKHLLSDEPEARQQREHLRELEYYFKLTRTVLDAALQWACECLSALEVENFSEDDKRESGLSFLLSALVHFMSEAAFKTPGLEEEILNLLDLLMSSSLGPEIATFEMDSLLVDRLIDTLAHDENVLQVQLLRLIPVTINLRLHASHHERRETFPENDRKASMTAGRTSLLPQQRNDRHTRLTHMQGPPARLLHCIQMGMTSRSARPYLDEWLNFLNRVLPTFADVIFSSLIPLVERLCDEIKSAFRSLQGMASSHSSEREQAPDTTILGLLEALELILARAHDRLVSEDDQDALSKQQSHGNGVLGSIAPKVFHAEGPPSRTSQANSRLTVVLAFQDAIRTCLGMWTWSNNSQDAQTLDATSAATISFVALRLRNKTRHLLEQMFLVEPLESLEVVIVQWRSAETYAEAAAVLSLLQVMQGSRPKNVVPAVLDAICSRTNPQALPAFRQSSQTIDVSATDVALFLLAYLDMTEDDAMDEVWSDSLSFLRDVLGNPMPHRMILSPLLSVVHLLARKVGNTNFGEQRKMKRELGDIFQRLLAACFATIPSATILESGIHGRSSEQSGRRLDFDAAKLIAVLTGAIRDAETILETSDRIATAVNTITSSLFSPAFRAKSFPANVDVELLQLLVEVQKKAPNVKSWKREVADAFNDPRLLATPLHAMEGGWLPVLYQWSFREKECMSELLSRLTPPSSAGIMFGVGASAARLEADRRTQLTLRRISLLLLSSPEDTWAFHLRAFDEKIVELSAASATSSPSSAIKAELYILCMALVLSLSPFQLSPLWPTINDTLQAALENLYATSTTEQSFTNFGLLQACKLLDQLIMMSPDEFQLHAWLYIADTIDAVYRPDNMTPTALADQVAESLGPLAMEDSQDLEPPSPSVMAGGKPRRLLLGANLPVDIADLKALPREDFVRTVLRPFLSQLSIHAYEGVYSMEAPDTKACRHRLLRDLVDFSTIVS